MRDAGAKLRPEPRASGLPARVERKAPCSGLSLRVSPLRYLDAIENSHEQARHMHCLGRLPRIVVVDLSKRTTFTGVERPTVIPSARAATSRNAWPIITFQFTGRDTPRRRGETFIGAM